MHAVISHRSGRLIFYVQVISLLDYEYLIYDLSLHLRPHTINKYVDDFCYSGMNNTDRKFDFVLFLH